MITIRLVLLGAAVVAPLLCDAAGGAPSGAAVAVEPGPFHLPPPPDPNVTKLTDGYNPWMDIYTGSDDPNVLAFVMITSGCVEGIGSPFFEDAAPGFARRCEELGVACQCRPVPSPIPRR